MANKLIYYDGAKSMNIQDSWDFMDAMKGEAAPNELYAKVAASFQAVNKSARAVANMPFVLKKGDEIFDDSTAWKNKVGFMPNPRDLLRRLRHSLIMTNTAYLRMGRNVAGIAKKLNYTVPTSIDIKTNQATGELIGLARSVNGRIVQTFAADDPDLIRFWWLDEKTELLPSKDTEFQAMMGAAGILYYSDFFTENFYKRGGVKPTLIAMKGMVMGDKKDELQKDWTQWVRGIGKFANNITAKLFNADTMDIKSFGEGLGDLKDTPVYRQALENIAIGLDMPLSLLLSNSANYATAQTEYVQWFRNSVTPWCDFIADTMNEQLFEAMGLHMEFTPENTDPEQEDEVQRTNALSTMGDAIAKFSDADTFLGAAGVFGFELTDEFIAAVQKYYGNKQANAEALKEQLKPKEQPAEVAPIEPIPAKWLPSLDELEDMRVWRELAMKKQRKGEAVTFEYLPHYGGLPADIANTIKAKLESASTIEEVKAAFVVEDKPMQDQTEIKALAASVDRLIFAALSEGYKVEAPSFKQDGQVFNLTMPTINLTTQMPAQGTVMVNVPEQPAPIVNVTNTPAVNNVTVKADAPINNITVQPAKLVLPPMPTEATITTDKATGKKTLKVNK
jgi:hypothetical protein